MLKVIKMRKLKKIKRINVLKKDRKYISLNNFYREKNKIFLLLVSILGIFIGVMCYKTIDNTNLTHIISELFSNLNSGNFKLIFLYFFKLDLICFLISFFIGTSFIGSVLSFIPPTIKCIYIGCLSSNIYNEFELKGVLFCLLLLYPCFAITTASLILASNENIYMSKYIYNCLNGKNTADNISLRLYLFRYILLFTITIIGIAITSFLILFIAPKINII